LIKEISILTWGGLFAVYLCVDVLYTKYVIAVSKYQAINAANYSLLMYALTAWGTIEYVNNFWNAVPIGLGAWLGTYLTLHNENRKEQERSHKARRNSRVV
jgi:hypothetical protein